MADTDGEDGYSDDDLDALANEDFLQLQQNALQSTQQPRRTLNSQSKPPALPPTTGAHAGFARHQKAGNTSSGRQAQAYRNNASSDYGDLDDEVLDGGLLDDPKELPASKAANYALSLAGGESTQREQWRQQRFSIPQQIGATAQARRDDQPGPALSLPERSRSSNSGAWHHVDEHEMLDEGEVDPPPAEQKHSVNTLHTKVEEVGRMYTIYVNSNMLIRMTKLLRERDALQQALQIANDQVHIKAGEASIVRANQARALKDHERQLNELQRQYADVAAKQRAEIEHTRVEIEKLLTEKKYLQHDLLEESERVKQVQRTAKTSVAGNAASKNKGIVTTPKHSRTLPIGDGFDDDEIMVVSPSKRAGKSKPGTPKPAVKKKRKLAEESPSQSLQLIQPQDDVLPDAPAPLNVPSPKKRTFNGPDARFEFTQKFLNHRSGANEKRSIEALADFAFPSESAGNEGKLSTLLLDKLSLLGTVQDAETFPASVGSIVVTLWSRCISDKYYAPLRILLDLVKFIIMSTPSTTALYLRDEVVELAQRTADINVIPRFERSRPVSASRPKEDLEINAEVDTTECLQTLYLIGIACARRQEDITCFWHFIRFDFVMRLCKMAHPAEDIHLMLKLLHTSVQENTFAMLTTPVDQEENEQHVIGQIVAMLIDVPRTAAGEKPYDPVEIVDIRLQILYLLEKLCDKKHGGEALAKHSHVIGRLVRVMNDELNALYDHKAGHEHRFDFPLAPSFVSHKLTCHPRAELINHATRLLFHLTSAYPHHINMQQKLQTTPGGVYKHLIALTRLAYSEGIFLEAGIEDDVVDCAAVMLENTVTPEEGEALFEVFSSAKK